MLLMGNFVKKILLFMAAVIILSGCDDKFQLSMLAPPSDPPSISEMIASGKEELASECKRGSVTYECEFLTGDLLGSGKWHHTKIYLHNDGAATMNIDGDSYSQRSVDRSFYDGDNIIKIMMAGVRGGTATLQIISSNEGKSLIFDAYDSEDKKFVMGGTEIN